MAKNPHDAKKREYDEDGRRVRAALAYSRLTRDEFAEGAKARTLDRTMAGERAPSLPELRRIAKVSGVPLLFLTHGWALYEALERLQASADDAGAASYLQSLLQATRLQQRLPPRSGEDRRRGSG